MSLEQKFGTSRRIFLAGAGSITAACRQTSGRWTKYAGSPVLGGSLGTCFDCCVLRLADRYRMWFSWRPKKAIAWTDSRDGINWQSPRIALDGLPGSDWEQEVNRPIVAADPARASFRMWYTGQSSAGSAIGYAESVDGIAWRRIGRDPVLTPTAAWEKSAVMAPHVNWDEEDHLYKMWFSGGSQEEPDAVGYAISTDGLHWRRPFTGPVFTPLRDAGWERDRVTAAQVIRRKGTYYAFYIGFRDINHAAIGLAKSSDGVSNWQRHPANPIIRPGLWGWDRSSCYKPFALAERGRWMLWYNGRNRNVEQIGLATHDGESFDF